MMLFKQARFWWGATLIGFVFLLRYSGLIDYLSLEIIQNRRAQFEHIVMAYYVWSVLGYIGVYILVVVLGLPLVLICTLVGGFLFGVIPGVFYANIGATIGSLIFFLLIRYSLGSVLQHQYAVQLSWINTQVERYGAWYFLSIRFLSSIPFFVENTLMGLTKVSVWTFVWTTSLGIIPGSLVYAYTGRRLLTITSLNEVFSVGMLVVFVFLALLALVPILVRSFLEKKN